MISKEKFKERIRELVDTLGISKTKCAKEIGISYKSFNAMYTLGKYPRICALIKVARHFQVSMDYLLCISDEKQLTLKK